MVHRPRRGRHAVRHRRRHAGPHRQRRSAERYTLGCHSMRHIVGGCSTSSRGEAARRPYNCVSCLNAGTCCGPGSACSGSASPTSTSGSARWASGRIGGSSDAGAETIEHDVLVIGAGGAGLRAAIEASAAGVLGRPGLQVAARQGAHRDGRGRHAAALANVDDRDNWKVHFADTMRGGQYLNNWRMAELHAKEAPGPRARARGLGRALRSHPGRPDPPAQLRRPPLSPPGARRRSHRAGDDPHAAGPRRPSGHRRAHGGDRRTPAQGRRPRRRRVRLRPRARTVPLFRAKAVVLATGGIGSAYKITATAGSTPATATRWPTSRAPS